jgi:hypothetical protein
MFLLLAAGAARAEDPPVDQGLATYAMLRRAARDDEGRSSASQAISSLGSENENSARLPMSRNCRFVCSWDNGAPVDERRADRRAHLPPARELGERS